MPSTRTVPIVGMAYHPPAKALTMNLTVGTPLRLEAEPDNPADPNAIIIYVLGDDCADQRDRLEEPLGDFGVTWDEFITTHTVLGYVPRDIAEELRSSDLILVGEIYSAAFSLGITGGPAAEINLTPQPRAGAPS